MKLSAELKPESVTVIQDTREQIGVDVSPLKMVDGSLPTGDYTVLGLEDHIAIELDQRPPDGANTQTANATSRAKP